MAVFEGVATQEYILPDQSGIERHKSMHAPASVNALPGIPNDVWGRVVASGSQRRGSEIVGYRPAKRGRSGQGVPGEGRPGMGGLFAASSAVAMFSRSTLTPGAFAT
jgi:hypothetical protein